MRFCLRTGNQALVRILWGDSKAFYHDRERHAITKAACNHGAVLCLMEWQKSGFPMHVALIVCLTRTSAKLTTCFVLHVVQGDLAWTAVDGGQSHAAGERREDRFCS